MNNGTLSGCENAWCRRSASYADVACMLSMPSACEIVIGDISSIINGVVDLRRGRKVLSSSELSCYYGGC